MADGHVDAAARQQRWEYKCEQLGSVEQLEAALDTLGNDCWELVSILPAGGMWTAICKRPQDVSGRRKTVRANQVMNSVLRRPR